MKIYYIHEANDRTHSVFEGTAEQFSDKFGGGSNNDESINAYVTNKGLSLVIFNDIPEDYYQKENHYNHKGIIIGYTLFSSGKVGY